jgi:molybdate-binding protein
VKEFESQNCDVSRNHKPAMPCHGVSGTYRRKRGMVARDRMPLEASDTEEAERSGMTEMNSGGGSGTRENIAHLPRARQGEDTGKGII